MNLQSAAWRSPMASRRPAMLAGLLLMRADARAYWRWPVYSAMAMALGVVMWTLLRKHLLSPEWEITRSQMLLYGALGMYALIGFAAGILLGRLTRVRTNLD